MTAWQPGMPQAGPWPQPPPQQPPPQRPPEARVSPGVLVGVSLWRLLIVAFGAIGFVLAVDNAGSFGSAFPGLSQQASLLAAIVYFGLLVYPACTGFRRHEPNSPWLRGAMTVLLLLVGGTFLTLMGGDLGEGWSLFEHLLTPLVLLIDWVAVGRNQLNCRWWHPLTWIVFPLAYLIYYNVAGLDMYDFSLSFGDSEFIGYFFGFIAGILLAGYLLYGIAKGRGSVAGQRPPVQQPMPAYGPQSQAWQQHPPQPPYQPPQYQPQQYQPQQYPPNGQQPQHNPYRGQ